MLLFVTSTAAAQAPSSFITTLNGTLGTAPPGGVTGTVDARLVRDATSLCAGPLPSTFFTISGGPFLYNAHSFTNPSGAPLCVTITLGVLTAGENLTNLHVAAYQSPFAPADITNFAKFLGDPGRASGFFPASEPTSFNLTIPAGGTIAIIVMSDQQAFGGGATYRLTVSEFCNAASCPTADFTGDRRSDIAVFRPSNGTWYVRRSETGTFYGAPFGTAGDIPAPADFEGDGKADLAVLRPSDGVFYIGHSNGTFTFQPVGAAGDVPVAANYDGDARSDISIFRPSTGLWAIRNSTGGTTVVQFGTATDKTVQGDYTGDGKADVAVWRPAAGTWYILRSEDGAVLALPFGQNGDIPTPGDYDGDGRFDLAVFRPASGIWYVNRSTAGFMAVPFGAATDLPVPSAFVR